MALFSLEQRPEVIEEVTVIELRLAYQGLEIRNLHIVTFTVHNPSRLNVVKVRLTCTELSPRRSARSSCDSGKRRLQPVPVCRRRWCISNRKCAIFFLALRRATFTSLSVISTC